MLFLEVYFKFGLSYIGLALIAIAVITLPLVVIDTKIQRLPNILLGSAAIWLLLISGLNCVFSGDAYVLVRPILNSLSCLSFFLLIRILSRNGLGMGDVKLAALLGYAGGLISTPTSIAAVLLSFFSAGIVAIALLASRLKGRKSAIPFGPFMLMGFWVAVILGPSKCQEISKLWLP
jgi:leader peptidase (prepilin peptidase)/N-methyltransferase